MSGDVIRFYDTFAPLYPVLDIFLHRHKRTLAQRINAQPPGRLLEIGVGRGEHLRFYKDKTITAIDPSRGMLAFAQKNAPQGTELHLMNAEALAFDDASFAYAVIAHVLTVVPDPLAVMDEVHRVLAPGGKVFILNRAAAHNAFNRILDPVVSKVLRFSAGFDEVRTFPHDKFTLLERTCCGIFPNVTLFVLEKTQTNPAE